MTTPSESPKLTADPQIGTLTEALFELWAIETGSQSAERFSLSVQRIRAALLSCFLDRIASLTTPPPVPPVTSEQYRGFRAFTGDWDRLLLQAGDKENTVARCIQELKERLEHLEPPFP